MDGRNARLILPTGATVETSACGDREVRLGSVRTPLQIERRMIRRGDRFRREGADSSFAERLRGRALGSPA
jgi:hypothetical protein